MKIGRIFWIIGTAVLVLVVNVALTVAYMVVYGYLINPGQPENVYQEHVQTAGPVCSIVFGIPLFYLAGRLIGGKWERAAAVRSAVLVWVVYFLIDVTVLAVSGLTLSIAFLAAVSLTTKLAAAYLGGVSAGRRAGFSV